MKQSKIIMVGGWSLILFTFLYIGTQVYLKVFFNYPDVLHGPDKDVIPVFLSGGLHLAIMLTLLSLLPLLLVPGSIGAYYAFKEESEGSMLLALIFAMIAILGFILCLMRWPSVNWYIALTYVQANDAERVVLSGLLLSLNTYLGTYLGGFLTSVCSSIWFFSYQCCHVAFTWFSKMDWLHGNNSRYLFINRTAR